MIVGKLKIRFSGRVLDALRFRNTRADRAGDLLGHNRIGLSVALAMLDPLLVLPAVGRAVRQPKLAGAWIWRDVL